MKENMQNETRFYDAVPVNGYSPTTMGKALYDRGFMRWHYLVESPEGHYTALMDVWEKQIPIDGTPVRLIVNALIPQEIRVQVKHTGNESEEPAIRSSTQILLEDILRIEKEVL